MKNEKTKNTRTIQMGIRPVLEKRTRQVAWTLLRGVFILGFCFVILYPLLNMISRAFMHPVDLYDNSILWIPKHFTLTNIRLMASAMNYGSAFFNSLWMSTIITVFQLLSCMMAGYGFARYNFPFKKILFSVVILTLIVPPQLTMVSSYIHFQYFDVFGIIHLITGKNGINLLDSPIPFLLLGLTANGIKNGLFIYIFRQAFRSMPKETEEAAIVDGAGHMTTFFKIMVPSAVTSTVTVTLFSFVWQWNDIFYSSLYFKEFKNLPIALLKGTKITADIVSNINPELARFNFGDPVFAANLTSTATLLVVAPLIILFIILQRYFVESIERSGIVG